MFPPSQGEAWFKIGLARSLNQPKDDERSPQDDDDEG